MKVISPLKIQNGGNQNFLSMENLEYFFKTYIQSNLVEQTRILPESVLFGVGIMALVTQSFSSSILLLSLFETLLIGTGLKNLFTYIDFFHTSPLQYQDSTCLPASLFPSIERLLNFTSKDVKSAFPSFPILFLTTAASYIISSMYAQKEELEALGPEYSSRYYIAIFISFILLFSLSAYRIAFNCEGAGIVILSLVLGIILGALFVYQNNLLFGRDSTNLTAIPLLKDRTSENKPLYVCPQKV